MSNGAAPYQQHTNARVEIAVQPPQIVTVNRTLLPPVVARTSSRRLIEDIEMGGATAFGTAQLVAGNGTDATGVALSGPYQVTGGVVTEEHSSSSSSSGGSSSRHSQPRRWVYFVFPGLLVMATGTYTLTISATVLDAAGAVTLGWRSTRSFVVTSQMVQPQRPSSAERQILNTLERAGLYRR